MSPFPSCVFISYLCTTCNISFGFVFSILLSFPVYMKHSGGTGWVGVSAFHLLYFIFLIFYFSHWLLYMCSISSHYCSFVHFSLIIGIFDTMIKISSMYPFLFHFPTNSFHPSYFIRLSVYIPNFFLSSCSAHWLLTPWIEREGRVG